MKKFFLLFSIFSLPLLASELDPLLLVQSDHSHLNINNRVLASVQGEPITVIDLTKRLDMIFFREFPQFAGSSFAKFQFYQSNWKAVLEELIQKQLIKADAEESKIEISHGEVRQQIEKIFGPNIVANLKKVGLSIEDASKMVQEDLLIDRMIGFRVHSKVYRTVTPSEIWNSYLEFSKNDKHAKEPLWEYRYLTFSDENPEFSRRCAERALSALQERTATLDELETALRNEMELPETSKIHVTPLLQQKEEELSAPFRGILSQLSANSFSQVVEQQSRVSKAIVHRIFYLQKRQEGGIPPFEEKEQELRLALLETEYEKQSEIYYAHLNEYFDVQKPYLEDEQFQPFLLEMP